MKNNVFIVKTPKMTFLTLINKIKRKFNFIKILVLGLDNSGKSSIIKIIEESYTKKTQNENIKPTFGYNVVNIKHNDFLISLFDIGGQSLFLNYYNNYFENVDGIIYVYDITDQRKLYLKDLDEKFNLNIPMIILANKTDLLNKEIEIKENNKKIFKTSIKNKENIIKAFDYIITDIIKKIN